MPRSIPHLSFALAVVGLPACTTSGSDDPSATAATDTHASETADGSGVDDMVGPSSEVAFADLNGVMWIYSTVNDITFASIEADLDDYAAGGIRILGIYSPYAGEKDQWLGAAPTDFYATPPQCGSLDDFRSLVDAAHARDMKIIAFMGFHSLDERAPFFTTAEQQFKTGDRSSREVAAFTWTDSDESPLPTPIPGGPSAWKRSETAGAYYWSLWDNAGLHVGTPGGAAESERAIDFWFDIGLDGVMLDSGVVDPAFRHLWVDVPERQPRPLWLTFESTWAEEAEDFDGFGLTSWFLFEDNDDANTYTLATLPEDGETAIDMDELESQLAGIDVARASGKTTHAWSILEREYPDPIMRVQEAALLAGAGALYGAPDAGAAEDWPTDVTTAWHRVLVAVNANAALRPSASRTRVASPTAGGYAMLRDATDGSQTALLVFNLTAGAQTVELDVAGAGLATDQVPIDLVEGATMPAITGASYALELPAWGFALLQVDRA